MLAALAVVVLLILGVVQCWRLGDISPLWPHLIYAVCAACLAVCLGLGFLLGSLWLGIPLWVLAAGAFLVTLLELYNLGVDDNLLLPVSGAAGMQVLMWVSMCGQ
ncbi:hypothetical protein HQ520_12770, partial [bacterium]|nr:hypothetical protein [bacterium]